MGRTLPPASIVFLQMKEDFKKFEKALCDYNSETTPANNLVCRAEEKTDVSEHEWKGKRKNARHGSS